MKEGFVKAIASASIAWWRWSLRFVQSFIRLIFLPSLSSTISVKPNFSYFSKFSSFITSTNCQSSRRRLVISPVVGVTVLTNSPKISHAFFAMYCVLRRSRSIKPEGISASAINSLLYFALLITSLSKSISSFFLYASAPSSPYFSLMKSKAVLLLLARFISRASSVLFEKESSNKRAFGMICSISKSLEKSLSLGIYVSEYSVLKPFGLSSSYSLYFIMSFLLMYESANSFSRISRIRWFSALP